MIISFSHTTPALLAGHKTVTRRAWSDRTAEYFTRRLRSYEGLAAFTGSRVGVATDAYDKSPRNGGRKVATINVLSVSREPLSAMPDSDYEGEGFAWLAQSGADLGDVWGIVPARQYPSLIKLVTAPSREYFTLAQQSPEELWVVRFQLVQVLA